MARRDKVIKVVAAAHLAIAALYGLHVQVERYLPEAIDRPLSIYGAFTGARTRFDFFAPAVASEARADFTVVPASGPSRRVRLSTPSGEANRRLALMFTLYAYPSEQQRLLQAWGDYVLRLHPEAVEVVARVEVLDIPTMRERAAGKPASWIEVARTSVRRADAPGS